jgi:hypothetical protein
MFAKTLHKLKNLIKILLTFLKGGYMLRKVADCMQIAQDVVHPLHPLQSVTQICVGALSILSVPITGTIGLINGIAGISKGSLDAAQDLAEAGCTISNLSQKKPVSIKEAAHLTVSLGVISVALFTVLNPVVALVAAKTSAIFMSKAVLTTFCLI